MTEDFLGTFVYSELKDMPGPEAQNEIVESHHTKPWIMTTIIENGRTIDIEPRTSLVGFLEHQESRDYGPLLSLTIHNLFWQDEYTDDLPIPMQNTVAMILYGEILTQAKRTYQQEVQTRKHHLCLVGSMPNEILAEICFFALLDPNDYYRDPKQHIDNPEAYNKEPGRYPRSPLSFFALPDPNDYYRDPKQHIDNPGAHNKEPGRYPRSPSSFIV